VDFLFSGCSVTYGTGLSQDDLWHEMLVKELGGEYASVAFAGDSIPSQVLKIFAYIKEFGNPKNIICLFPNFDRFLIYNNKNLLASRIFFRYYHDEEYNEMTSGNKTELESKAYLSDLFKSSADIYDTNGNTSYFKTPLPANDVITQEISHMYSAQFINMLSQYCAISGIKFIWGTWDFPSNLIIQKVKNNLYFSENIDIDLSNLHRDFNAKTDFDPTHNCHLKYQDHPEFHFASDRSIGVEHSHHGVHRQLHYFEAFLNKINEGE
jgi:uncharacterized protein YqgQ